MAHRMITHKIYSNNNWYWYLKPLVELMSELQAWLEKAPEEWRHKVMIDIEGRSDERVSVEVYYATPETEEERVAREFKEDQERIRRMTYLETEIARLKANDRTN